MLAVDCKQRAGDWFLVLSRFYEILAKASSVKDDGLWDRLTSEEKLELLQIDSETDSDDTLIPLQTIKDKHKKWRLYTRHAR